MSDRMHFTFVELRLASRDIVA